MARISGVNIPSEKRVLIALTYVHGIGRHTSEQLLDALNLDHNTRVKDMTEDELSRVNNYIADNLTVEGDLQRTVSANIKRLKDISSYRGERHRRRLPTRGQRTRTNARTKRGSKVAVGGAQPKAASKT